MEDSHSTLNIDLATKYLSGECDTLEIQRFEEQLASSPQLQSEFEHLKAKRESSSQPKLDVNPTKSSTKVSATPSEIIPASNIDSKGFSRAIAAAVIATLCVGTLFWYLTKSDLERFSSSENIASLTLSDGSEITLQGNSWIDFPAEFEGDSRRVSLNGTAFFKVTADENHPFIVETQVGRVIAIGTTFEVTTRDKVSELVVMVEEGTVEVSNRASTTYTQVKDGQICTLSNNLKGLVVKEMDDDSHFLWKNKTH